MTYFKSHSEWRVLLIAFFLLLGVEPALAEPWKTCRNLGTVVDALAMTSTRSFDSAAFLNLNEGWGFDHVVLVIQLVDANASITRFDTTCTVSLDGNVTDLTPQIETVAAGVATQTDAGIWQKASPGSKNWPIRFNGGGYPAFQCSFAVGAGAGASGDLLTVKARVCTK